MGREFFGGNSSLEKLSRIFIRNYFYLSCFLFADSVLHVEMLGGIAPENFLTRSELSRVTLA